MTVGATYNAKVTGINANGLIVLETPDGAKAIAQQTGNGVLSIGQPVVLQRSGVPGVSDICFDPTATPTPPKVWPKNEEALEDRGNIWILYIYEGKLWVGGHRKEPEPVYSSYTGANGQRLQASYSSNGGGGIFVDGRGWEVIFGSDGGPLPIASFARSKAKAKLSSQNTNSNLGYSLIDSTALPGVGVLTVYNEQEGAYVNNIKTDSYARSWSIGFESYSKSFTGTGSQSYSQVRIGLSAGEDSNKYGSTATETATELVPLIDKTNSLSYYESSGGEYNGLAGSPGYYSEQNSSTIWNMAIRDRTWSIVTKEEYSFSSSATKPPFGSFPNPIPFTSSTSVTLYATNGQTDVELYTLPDKSSALKDSIGTNLSFPVVTILDNQPTYTVPDKANPAGPDIVKQRYKHFGKKVAYNVKVRDVYSKASWTGAQPAAEIKAYAWGIPENATVIDASCWLPGLAKYSSR